MNLEADRWSERDEPRPLRYEPPRIERVLTAEELAREVLYAGTDGSPHVS